jgi:hypothetical protein
MFPCAYVSPHRRFGVAVGYLVQNVKATAGATTLPVGKIASDFAKMRARIDEPHFLLAEPGKLRLTYDLAQAPVIARTDPPKNVM